MCLDNYYLLRVKWRFKNHVTPFALILFSTICCSHCLLFKIKQELTVFISICHLFFCQSQRNVHSAFKNISLIELKDFMCYIAVIGFTQTGLCRLVRGHQIAFTKNAVAKKRKAFFESPTHSATRTYLFNCPGSLYKLCLQAKEREYYLLMSLVARGDEFMNTV